MLAHPLTNSPGDSPETARTNAIAHLLRAWASLRRREFVGFALAGLVFGLVDLCSALEMPLGAQWPPAILRQLLEPVLATLILLLCWLPAERSAAAHPQRVRRLAWAVGLGSLVSVTLVGLLEPALPWPSISDIIRAQHHLPPLPGLTWRGVLGDALWVLLPSSMMVGMLELLRRQRADQRALAYLLDEQAQLRRRAMAARLATLQAQVEPQLLFDALVDIERAYAHGDGAARMELLIRHLRVALPRLRDSGSTLDQEADLLDSYLGVLRQLQRAPLQLRTRWAPELGGAAVPPMVLLPLLQRALRLAEPRECRLEASLGGGTLAVRLEFDRPGLCNADDELRALEQRVKVLANGPARLRCETGADLHTTFTLELAL